MKQTYDFGGWVTKNDLLCSDGRTIRQDAFKHNDGKKVPLVWMHMHGDVGNVLGNVVLQNRPEGVYGYGTFNNTASGLDAKQLVAHGDIVSLSIFANNLKQVGKDVIHGAIREVSLVMAGANEGAMIDTVLAHGDDFDEEAVIYSGEPLELVHAEESSTDEKSGETLGDIFETFTDKQKEVVYEIVAQAMDKDIEAPDEVEHSDEDNNKEEITEMRHNLFEGKDQEKDKDVLTHDDLAKIFSDGKRLGSLKESVLQHGITDIEYLFPDAKNVTATPTMITRAMTWVSTVMQGVRHTPFSRIKSLFADITEDEARARGYIKGKQKKEEVFTLLKRTTSPQTIYKKQKLDRDDILDITDFDVVTWLKSEMRVMLDEELARAILIGDGRLSSSDDKISEEHIRPIWKDADLFTIKYNVEFAPTASDDDKARAFIRSAVKARENYKGSGQPSLFTTEEMLTNCLLMTDTTGRIIYESVDKLATAMRVSSIVTVEVMKNVSRVREDSAVVELLGLIVSLSDYNVGADKGGAVNMFEDFDIDFNAQKYLIETRCSGALIRPYSAIALEAVKA